MLENYILSPTAFYLSPTKNLYNKNLLFMFLIATRADIAFFFLQLLNYYFNSNFFPQQDKKGSFIKNFVMILHQLGFKSTLP